MRYLILLVALAACSKEDPTPTPLTPPKAEAAVPAAQTEKDKALANPYPNDLGPETLPDSLLATYDADKKKGYELMRARCSQCHTSARPLNSRFEDSDVWNRYVKRMMNKPGCVMTKAEAKQIWQFLVYDSDKRKKGAQAAAWKAHRAKLVADFKAQHPKRYDELAAANDL
ncbi:MAG: hypothetical protein M0D55_08455 [Elusimicrobiota bacterium]|nr:MAG: hypothetical protein M0D55_08455 [Elusimicrobiota bacterium]